VHAPRQASNNGNRENPPPAPVPKRMDRVPLGILFMLGAPLYR
jgi:hypothetical protein